MEKYNLYRATETGKCAALETIKKAGATVTGVSGCGTGFYIQLEATLEQANRIDQMILQEGATV